MCELNVFIYIIACPPCQFDDHEVCVLPKNGSPHCECADGYAKDRHHKCVPCVQGTGPGTNERGATYEPRHEKKQRSGFRPGPTQTRLYSHRRWLEA